MGLRELLRPRHDPAGGRRDAPRARPVTRAAEVTINGVQLTLKYCVACGIPAPRASHRRTATAASTSGTLCPWIGNSVGRRNYVWFFAFLHDGHALGLRARSAHHLRLLAVRTPTRAASAPAPRCSPPPPPRRSRATLPVHGDDHVPAPPPRLPPPHLDQPDHQRERARPLRRARQPFDRGVGANVHEALRPLAHRRGHAHAAARGGRSPSRAAAAGSEAAAAEAAGA